VILDTAISGPETELNTVLTNLRDSVITGFPDHATRPRLHILFLKIELKMSQLMLTSNFKSAEMAALTTSSSVRTRTICSKLLRELQPMSSRLTTIVSEIDSLRVALNQNGWTDWCEKDAIRDLYEESSVLKTYAFAECTDARCGRDRMQNPVCDLKYVASTVLGRTPWLGHIASDLNEPHCFGGSCGLPEGDSTDETFTMPSEEISWDTCNFSMLFADAQALYSIIGTKGAWGDNEACTDDDVRSVYENSAVLSHSMCVESEVLEVSALVSNEWFGTLVSEIRVCYGTN